MGEFADMAYEQAEYEQLQWDFIIGELLERTNEQLIKDSSLSRLPLICGIRKYWKQHKKLSKKQRYCLARWIAEDEFHGGYEIDY